MTLPSAKRRLRGFSAATLLLSVAFLVGVAPVRADGTTTKDKAVKPAWQWTLDERLAKRFDPEARRARIAAKIAVEADFQKKVEAAGLPPLEGAGDFAERSRREDLDVINGRQNPELFLPVELFGNLLLDAFPPGGIDPTEYRSMIESRAAALGFGTDLWPRLRRLAAPVLEFDRKREKLARTNPSAVHIHDGAKMDADELIFCRDRADALAKAEAEFGKEPFLRLLYEAVVPSSEVTYTLYEGIAEHKRSMEGGCR